MSIGEKVSITISISKVYRDRLRIMAAELNLQDPDQLTSASTIARETICEYIDNIDRIEADFMVGDNAAKSLQKAEQDESSESSTDK